MKRYQTNLKMRGLIRIVLLFVISSSFGQFQGRILYENSYEWKGDNLTSEQFTQYMGDRLEYYKKDSNYRSISNGFYYTNQFYSPSENKLYNQTNGSDTLIWFDASISSDTIVSYSVDETDEIILGYKCKVLTIKTTRGTGRYYFSDKLKIDPEPYMNHHYGNFSLVARETKSPSLKIEIENEQISLVFLAVKVEEMELKDSFFNIPSLPSKETSVY